MHNVRPRPPRRDENRLRAWPVEGRTGLALHLLKVAAPGSPAMVLVVWTDDVDAAYGHLVAAGVPVVQPPHNTGNNNRNALLRDPDGNLVEIVAKRSTKTR